MFIECVKHGSIVDLWMHLKASMACWVHDSSMMHHHWCTDALMHGGIRDASIMHQSMNILRSHGMKSEGLQEVYRSKILPRVLYAAPAWWGLASKSDYNRIDAFLKRSKKCGFYPEEGRPFEELCIDIDNRLLAKIINNKDHVLHQFLPHKKQHSYNLRQTRGHNFTLPIKDNRNFFNRTL